MIFKYRLLALILIIASVGVGYWLYQSEQTDGDSWWQRPFQLGLDLKGGSHLVYQADLSDINQADWPESMSALREVIERRINVFGVSEPLVQVEKGGLVEEGGYRLIVELPGVTDLEEALALIDKTPELEFKVERPDGSDKEAILEAHRVAEEAIANGATKEDLLIDNPLLAEDPHYVSSGLTGRFLRRASVAFDGQTVQQPGVSLEFDKQGTELFAELTEENLDRTIAIFLDGDLLSAPMVQDVIRTGQAEITGDFTVEEARDLARDLNLGALPVPIELVSTQTIGPTLGEKVLAQGIIAGLVGLVLVALFMLIWYRLPGLVAVISLAIYLVIMLAIFKLVPVTLTAAGIAGFIMSLGIAVDANVLIFERLKEELNRGLSLAEAIRNGFTRAWTSIRDSNLSSIISAIILFWFGTSLIQGFALTFGLGVIVSMFTAIIVTRTILLALGVSDSAKVVWFFYSGLPVISNKTNKV